MFSRTFLEEVIAGSAKLANEKIVVAPPRQKAAHAMLLVFVSVLATHRPAWDTPEDHLALADHYHLPSNCSAEQLDEAIKAEFAATILAGFGASRSPDEHWHSWTPLSSIHSRELQLGSAACSLLDRLPFVGPGQLCSCDATNQGTGLVAGCSFSIVSYLTFGAKIDIQPCAQQAYLNLYLNVGFGYMLYKSIEYGHTASVDISRPALYLPPSLPAFKLFLKAYLRIDGNPSSTNVRVRCGVLDRASLKYSLPVPPILLLLP